MGILGANKKTKVGARATTGKVHRTKPLDV